MSGQVQIQIQFAFPDVEHFQMTVTGVPSEVSIVLPLDMAQNVFTQALAQIKEHKSKIVVPEPKLILPRGVAKNGG